MARKTRRPKVVDHIDPLRGPALSGLQFGTGLRAVEHHERANSHNARKRLASRSGRGCTSYVAALGEHSLRPVCRLEYPTAACV